MRNTSILLLGATLLPSLTILACGAAPDDPSEDVSEHADALVNEVMLKRGFVQTEPTCVTPPSSDGASEMINSLTALGGTVQSDVQSCIVANKEVFTGVSVMAPFYFPLPGHPAPHTYVDQYGGAGRTMAEAGVCALREAFVQAIPLAIPPANGVSASMSIGGTRWDPTNKTIEGYRSLKLTVPLLGEITTRPQWFSASVASSSPAFYPGTNSTPYSGSKLITNAYSLWVKAESSDRKIKVKLPSLAVWTPYGQFSADPSFEYEARSQLVWPPTTNGSNAVTSDVSLPFNLWFGTGKLADLYGRDTGGNFADGESGNLLSARGWASSIGLGGRGKNAKWNGVGARPDAALATPRFDGLVSSSNFQAEAAPNAHAKADVAIKFDAAKVLPAFLTSTPFATEFSLTVTPSISADFWSQLFIHSAEGYSTNPDVGYEDRAGSLLLRGGLTGKSSVSVTANLKLFIDLDLNWGFGHLHEEIVHIDLPLPAILSGTPASKYAETYATKGKVAWEKNNTMQNTVLDPPHFDDAKVTTLGGNGVQVASPEAWRDTCLAAPLATKPPPNATYQPGTAQELVDKAVMPCNICVAVGGGSRQVTDPMTGQTHVWNIQGSNTKLLPGDYDGLEEWTCNAVTNECFDLCKVVVHADGSRTAEVLVTAPDRDSSCLIIQ